MVFTSAKDRLKVVGDPILDACHDKIQISDTDTGANEGRIPQQILNRSSYLDFSLSYLAHVPCCHPALIIITCDTVSDVIFLHVLDSSRLDSVSSDF